jgi:Sec-independent protein translocase protein TatA
MINTNSPHQTPGRQNLPNDTEKNLRQKLRDLQRLYDTSRKEIKSLNQELCQAWSKQKKNDQSNDLELKYQSSEKSLSLMQDKIQIDRKEVEILKQ